MSLPKDPVMLYSAVNMKLRDSYSSLEDLCESEGVEMSYIVNTLKAAGFEYNASINQFR